MGMGYGTHHCYGSGKDFDMRYRTHQCYGSGNVIVMQCLTRHCYGCKNTILWDVGHIIVMSMGFSKLFRYCLNPLQ